MRTSAAGLLDGSETDDPASRGGLAPILIAVAMGVSALVWLFSAFGPGLGSSNSAGKTASAATLQKGLQAHRAGKVEDAEALYRKALEQDASNAYAYYNLGVIEQSRGNDDAAVADYRSTLKLKPGYSLAQFNLAIILEAREGGQREAAGLYRKVLAEQPSNAGATLNLGVLLHALGKPDEGDALIAQARAMNPAMPKNLGSSSSR